MSRLSTWLDLPRQYSRAARDQFLRVADYYLVVQAHAADHTVATFEKAEPNVKKRVAIPDVCMTVAYREPFGDLSQARVSIRVETSRLTR